MTEDAPEKDEKQDGSSGRPERVTLSTDLFEQTFLTLEQLPAAQVRHLLSALEADVRPVE